SNDENGPKCILFDANLTEAKIAMSTEELTVSGIKAKMQSEMSESQYSEFIQALGLYWPSALVILGH
ncbi:MAG: hypothetical protein DRI01_10845, partial [Chloroflexi bacterium]